MSAASYQVSAKKDSLRFLAFFAPWRLALKGSPQRRKKRQESQRSQFAERGVCHTSKDPGFKTTLGGSLRPPGWHCVQGQILCKKSNV